MSIDELNLICLRKTVQVGKRHLPYYVSFAPAASLDQLAMAPSFKSKTTNEAIAANVVSGVKTDWQRPLDERRAHLIRDRFDEAGHFMPNPVLLARNPLHKDYRPPEITHHGVPEDTVTYRVVLKKDSDGQLPLWILDGQHRIRGLALSKQKHNVIPVVLLIQSDQDESVYTERDLARVFAEVTTTARGLDPLHNEWMSYSFGVGKYSKNAADYEGQRDAMRAVALLGSKDRFAAGDPVNPFRNKIKFNPDGDPPGWGAGFNTFQCDELQEVLANSYFLRIGAVEKPGALTPEQLARQLVLARDALRILVSDPDKSVFLSPDRNHVQKIVGRAFVSGVCERLRFEEKPDWEALLRSLKFDSTDWDFKPWVAAGGLHGPSLAISETTVRNVFREVFAVGALGPHETIADILKGTTRLEVEFELVARDEQRRKISGLGDGCVFKDGSSIESLKVVGGASRAIRIVRHSSNVGKIELRRPRADTDAENLGLKQVKDQQKGGPLLPLSLGDKEIELEVVFFKYGGHSNKATLKITQG